MKIDEFEGRDRLYLEQLHIGELEDETIIDHIDAGTKAEIEGELGEDDARLFRRLPSGRFTAAVRERLATSQIPDAAVAEEAEGAAAAAEAAEAAEAEEAEGAAAAAEAAPAEETAAAAEGVGGSAGRSAGAEEGRRVLRGPWGRYLPLAAAAIIAAAVGFAGLESGLLGGVWGPAGVERSEGVHMDGQAEMGERIKGLEPLLSIYRAEEQGVRLLAERARAQRNDLLQLEYHGAGYPYGVILSIDGRGTVTLHYPAGAGMEPVLEGGRVLLPYAYQLDDAPAFERFFFVTSDERFDTRLVLRAARNLAAERGGGRRGKLRLPRGFEQSSMTILKERR